MKGLLDFGEGPDFILTAIVRPLSGVAQDVISQSLLKAHSAVAGSGTGSQQWRSIEQ